MAAAAAGWGTAPELDSMVPVGARAAAGGPAAGPSSGSGRVPRHPEPGCEVWSGLEPTSPPRPGSRLGGSRGSVGPAVRRWRPPALLPPSHPHPGGQALGGTRDGGAPAGGEAAARQSTQPEGRRPRHSLVCVRGRSLKGRVGGGRAWGGGTELGRRGRGGGAGLKGEDARLPEREGPKLGTGAGDKERGPRNLSS